MGRGASIFCREALDIGDGWDYDSIISVEVSGMKRDVDAGLRQPDMTGPVAGGDGTENHGNANGGRALWSDRRNVKLYRI